jgi:hypothetical protein
MDMFRMAANIHGMRSNAQTDASRVSNHVEWDERYPPRHMFRIAFGRYCSGVGRRGMALLSDSDTDRPAWQAWYMEIWINRHPYYSGGQVETEI